MKLTTTFSLIYNEFKKFAKKLLLVSRNQTAQAHVDDIFASCRFKFSIGIHLMPFEAVIDRQRKRYDNIARFISGNLQLVCELTGYDA